jgi:3,4-dihydroxy 2-butanone 4-phosphate synthase/GTP cyclohydrolase II
MPIARTRQALAALNEGRFVIVVDNDTPQSGGDLVMAAERITSRDMTFMIRNTSGVICAAMPGWRLDELNLPLMVAENSERRAAYTISVDARSGTTTGISAADRVATVQVLIGPETMPSDLTRPGHIFPLRASDGGLLKRCGRTEAAVDLARAAGLYPAGILAELVKDTGAVARRPYLDALASAYDFPIVSLDDIIRFRRRTEQLVKPISNARLPTQYGDFRIHVYESLVDGIQHTALVMGDVAGASDVLVRVHSECLTGDLFSSTRCDCGRQLHDAMSRIATAGRGVVVYLRGHEGRGIGLGHKVRAYGLQDQGRDTLQANLELGLPADKRDYSVGAQILADLGMSSMRLMTNNPAKYDGIAEFGLTISERLPLITEPTPDNVQYLQTKQRKMGHLLGFPREPAVQTS